MKRMRILAAGVLLAALAGSQATRAEGWSLPNPFSAKKTATKPNKPAYSAPQKAPSVGEKIGAGTKKFFGGIGDTLTWNKPEAKQSSSTYGARSGWSSSVKGTPPKKTSWWNPFRKEEPPPQRSLSDFVGMDRPD